MRKSYQEKWKKIKTNNKVGNKKKGVSTKQNTTVMKTKLYKIKECYRQIYATKFQSN